MISQEEDVDARALRRQGMSLSASGCSDTATSSPGTRIHPT